MVASRVALILGSSRAAGWSRKLGRALVQLAPPGLSLELVETGALPLYHEDLEACAPPEWRDFRRAVAERDAVLFLTPEYNRSIPAALKNAVDIGSSPDGASAWAGKPAAIASFSTGRVGGFGANHHLRQALVFLGMPVLPTPEIYLAEVTKLFGPDDSLMGARGLLADFLLAFRQWIARMSTRRGASRHV